MKNTTYLLFLFSISMLLSCGSEEVNTTEEILVEINSEMIEITQAQFDLGKMKLGTFSNQSFSKVIKANGMLDVPPENKSTLSAYFGGYVKNISLLQGQKITKGQTLFTLENPDYIQVQQEYLEAKSQLSYLKSDYERQKGLASENVSSQKTYLKAESEYKSTLARFESLKKKLSLMNINPNGVTEMNLTSTISVKAPISGFVTSVMASKGLFLNPSDVALTIMNTDNMLVELNIFEQDLTQVKIGQDVQFRIQNGKKDYQGEVFLINKAIDSENRSIKVHCHFKDEDEAKTLTPGMFVEAEIVASGDSSLALPVNAVISVEGNSFVLVKSENSERKYTFNKVEVKIGESSKGFVEVLNANDFDENTQFLTEGGFNLIQE